MTESNQPPSPQLDAVERRTLVALFDTLLPAAPATDGAPPVPGAGTAGGDRYVEQLLGAFDHDPPRIWAGGPSSGRHGGEDGFGRFLELSGWEAMAWRTRIAGWAEAYRTGLAQLGEDFGDLDDGERATRLDRLDESFRELAFEHACEALYGDPVYGGNADSAGWAAIDFRGDTAPTGWTDDEVSHPYGEAGPPW